MKRLLLGAILAIATGCHSNPYCLNCKDSGNGVLAPEDMTPGPDLAGAGSDMTQGVDMAHSSGCVPSNGGVEICDGLDNDCNGVIDDVAASHLVDPNNCGACGHVCKYPNAFGVCTATGTGPACSMGSCQPGHVDLDGNPANGCEYQCAPSNNGVELCDKVDNNCDGQVDEGFTATWADAAHQLPNYDGDIKNCGKCANLCNLPNAVMACQQPNPSAPTTGQCVLTACFNGNVTDNTGTHHETYRHNPSAGNINVVGCEYHCPKPAAQLNQDCRNDGACTFPAEVCNGLDDDCNFAVDDKLTDPGLGGRCPDNAPGKLCSDTAGNCVGDCAAGTLQCINGGIQCIGSKGPSPETCEGTDQDCDGKIDNGFTATWNPDGSPRYDSSAANCGGCGTSCGLPNATNGCRLNGGDTKGACYVVSCNAGWFYVTHKDGATPTCGVTITQPENSTQTTAGIGCNYQCAVSPQAPEVCDGKDNDCDGCVDNGLTGPSLCSTKGVCANASLTTKCNGAAGWTCDYSGVPNVSVDSNGNLTVTEPQCDNRDNNCNGNCDENFPSVQVNAASPEGVACNNPHAAATCSAGNGVCQTTGPYSCQKSAPTKTYNDIQACSATADNTKATDEKCNGKDDDCNGLIDEPTSATVGGTTFQGWHDPVVQVAVPAYPTATLGTCTDSTALCAAHTVYVYSYEASRPDALGTTPGSQSTRACANAGVLPWGNVTYNQAATACAGIKDTNGNSIGRLCTAWEWQQTCSQLAAPTSNHWSMSNSQSTYASGVCNDGNQVDQRCTSASMCTKTCNGSGQCTCGGDADCSPGFSCSGGICKGSGAWPTGVTGSSSAGSGNQCYVTFSSVQAHDLSGNLMEWTSTPVALRSGTTAHVSAVSNGQATISNLATNNFQASDVGAELVLSGAGNSANNGTFVIVGWVSSSSVIISAPNAAVDASNITWQFVYRKLRGGAYSTLQAPGLACEFDFDIQRASFANTDLGFRCCSDSKP